MSFYSTRKKSVKSKSLLNRSPKPNRSDYLSGLPVPKSIDSDDEDECLFLFNDYGTTSFSFQEEAICLKKEKNDKKEKNVNSKKKISFIEREITTRDSLANLALKYSCPVAELKRLNNIYYDQEIHAFDKIKIPVKPFSVLTDDNDSGHCSPCKEARIISIGSNLLQNSDSKDAFLRQMDLDLERIRQSTAGYSSTSLQEIAQELSCKRFHPLSCELKEKEKRENLKLCPVLILGAVVTFVIPLMVLVHFLLNRDV